MPELLKQTLSDYAARRALSQTRAVVELLEQALAASGGERSLAELEARLARCQRELEQARMRLRERELELQTGRQREQADRRYLPRARRPRSPAARPLSRLQETGARLRSARHRPLSPLRPGGD